MGKSSSAFWAWVVACGAALFALAMLDGSCNAGRQLRDAKLRYEAYRAVAEADHAAMTEKVSHMTNEISRLGAAIAEKDAKVAQYVERVSTLTAELTALQDAEPPTTPEIEALPIVVNLRGQVAKLTAAFSLAQDTITLQGEEIALLVGQRELLEGVAAEWRGAYEREHALRVQAEGLFKLSERRVGMNKVVTKVALGVAAAGVAYGLLK